MNEVCEEVEVRDNEIHEYFSNHGLRASMLPFLVEAGHPGYIIILRTGHTNTTTTKDIITCVVLKVCFIK